MIEKVVFSWERSESEDWIHLLGRTDDDDWDDEDQDLDEDFEDGDEDFEDYEDDEEDDYEEDDDDWYRRRRDNRSYHSDDEWN